MNASTGDALARTAQAIDDSGLELVRFAWCDTHGMLRGKTLTAAAAQRALYSGIGMVGTLMLKDSSDRTVFKVFEPGIERELPGFECAANLLLVPNPESFRVLPWAARTGWIQCQPVFQNGAPVPYDTRRQLQLALDRLAGRGLGMVCGLEVEFHIYRLRDGVSGTDLDPHAAAWPGPAPDVTLVHPGYNLLSEDCFDRSEEPLRIVQHTAQALGLPLLSLEVELGPSQFEAVFEATDALTAADNMVLFRSAVRQALRRAGYCATFMCRPPFAQVMSSGWHLHQSLVDMQTGRNVFARAAAAPGTSAGDALHTLSETGAHYLAGLLQHAPGMTVMCTPTANGFGRFRPHSMAPLAVGWGRDNRGALLRVVGAAGDTATRIENRLGEPAANPYLYMASQIHAGLPGIVRRHMPPSATDAPYADAGLASGAPIPATLGEALAALQADDAMRDGFGADFLRYYCRVKAGEQQRFDAAEDKLEFQRREYFGRI